MAPEQWEGHPVPATDQYALAIMVYELLVGHPPFQGRPGQVMRQHYQTPPPTPSTLNPHLSPALDAVLLRALSKEPNERFSSVTAFARAFQEAVQSNGELQATLAISRAEAQTGTIRRLTLPGGRQVSVTVPAGVGSGTILRLEGQGMPYYQGGPTGSLVLTISIALEEHPLLKQQGDEGPTALMSSEIVLDGQEQVVAEKAELFTHTDPSETAEPEAPTFPPPVKTPVPPVFERSPLTPVPLPSRDTPLHRALLPLTGDQPFIRRENVPLRKANAQRQAEGTTRLSWSRDKKSIALTSFLVVLAALLAVTVISPYLRGSTSSGQPTPSSLTPSGQSTPSSLTPSSSPTVDVTAVAEYNRYLQATSGAPTFFDPLANNDNNNWFVGQHGAIGKCYFENQAYHVTANPGYIHACGAFTSPVNSLSDFAFQLQITFVQGDAGGFSFDFPNGKGYVFYLRQNRTYTIYRYDGTKGTNLSFGKNPAISTGQGQQNLLSALIQKNTIDFFIKNQYITSISDNTYSQVSIALRAASFSASPVDIAFQNLKVWNLP